MYNTFVPEAAVELKSEKGKTREMFGGTFGDGGDSVLTVVHVALTSIEDDVLLGRIYRVSLSSRLVDLI
ncbi:MAG: hypothetical protein Q9212_000070 [Teloschistes hypoglaucus]